MAQIKGEEVSLYKDAKAGLSSLIKQVGQVFGGLILMLILTGGSPPSWIVVSSFFIGIVFVAWSENKRVTNEKFRSVKENSNKDETKRIVWTKVYQIEGNHNSSVLPRVKYNSRIKSSAIMPSIKPDEKWRKVCKVWKISTQSAFNSNLSGTNLKYADLTEINLSNADLSGADLSYTILRDSILRGANLSEANLERANLNKADLSFAILRGANLKGVKNLSEANLSSTDLSDSDLSGFDLSRVNLNGAKLNQTDLSNAKLNGASLIGAKLNGASLIGADLSDANLNEADISIADLRNANVKNTRFGDNLGISEDMKRDLKTRGAIFEDSPGDRSTVLTS
jgi:uncharacterized protein YjbI with pentapeptide repeats